MDITGIISRGDGGYCVVPLDANYPVLPVRSEDQKLCETGLRVNFAVQTVAVGSSEFDIQDCDVAQIKSIKNDKGLRVVHGIELTKPWSKEMYEHNEWVLRETIKNVKLALDNAYKSTHPREEVSSQSDLYRVAQAVCGYGWKGLSNERVYEDALSCLDSVASCWWMNDIYPDLVKQEYVIPVYPFFIGFNK